MNITVYLGANEGNDPALKQAVQELGRWIGESGNALVYGGSRCGLMGEIAESTLNAGGEVTGVEPEFFVQGELQHEGLTELIVTNDRAGGCVYCISRRHRHTGGDRRGDVQGVAQASGCALHPL